MTLHVVKFAWPSFVGFVLVLAGCGGTEIRSSRSDGAGGSGAGGSGSNILLDYSVPKTVDKIDLLFMIDNSPSMADKQAVLAQAVPDLISRLVSPICVNEDGSPSNVPAPPDPTVDCPAPTTREFKPIKDLHVAVITSSLGGHGAPICEGTEAENDHAELFGSRPRAASTVYPPGTPGFLDWNPAANPGEDVNQFFSSFQNMVRATGAEGCRFPAQLEAVYRFLSDPFPPQSVELQSCRGGAQCATPVGVDDVILAQRKAFLRPDSLVAVILITDRNDCSIRDSDQYYFAATVGGLLPRASTACGTNPNDPCCYSCGLPNPPDCPIIDPKCAGAPSLTAADDAPSLRCFEQKRRFGLDFLYPIKRYVTALTSWKLCTTKVDLAPGRDCPARPDGSPGLVDNPLFQDLTNCGAAPRDPSLVSVVGITGVPWQLIAQDPNDPTLLQYKSPAQMTDDGTWAKIVGDPTNPSGPVPPTDPHMQESIDPRSGLPGPNTPPDADPIHGHEWLITNRDDLQYACIFETPSPLPCVDSTCDCFSREPGDNNPLCAGPSGTYEHVQHKAKAYPSLRVLEVLQGVGRNAMVASLCARNLVDVNAQDYGYRPAIFFPANLAGPDGLMIECLPQKLSVAPDGTVPCTILEATTDPFWSCDPAMNRREPDPSLIEPARQRLAADKSCDSGTNTCLPDCSAFHFCEIMPADDSCLNVTPRPGSIGWCYVDPSTNRGDPSLVASCLNEQQVIRFVGDDTPVPNAVVLNTCGTDAGGGKAPNMGTGTVPPL